MHVYANVYMQMYILMCPLFLPCQFCLCNISYVEQQRIKILKLVTFVVVAVDNALIIIIIMFVMLFSVVVIVNVVFVVEFVVIVEVVASISRRTPIATDISTLYVVHFTLHFGPAANINIFIYLIIHQVYNKVDDEIKEVVLFFV